ncbi:hypothetical protein LXL04_032406 [Taraxacum kok-saghyz]
MSRPPSYSGVRELVPSHVTEEQNRAGSFDNRPPSFQHVAPRHPSFIQNYAIQDLKADPAPSRDGVNPHGNTWGFSVLEPEINKHSGTQHLIGQHGTTTTTKRRHPFIQNYAIQDLKADPAPSRDGVNPHGNTWGFSVLEPEINKHSGTQHLIGQHGTTTTTKRRHPFIQNYAIQDLKADPAPSRDGVNPHGNTWGFSVLEPEINKHSGTQHLIGQHGTTTTTKRRHPFIQNYAIQDLKDDPAPSRDGVNPHGNTWGFSVLEPEINKHSGTQHLIGQHGTTTTTKRRHPFIQNYAIQDLKADPAPSRDGVNPHGNTWGFSFLEPGINKHSGTQHLIGQHGTTTTTKPTSAGDSFDIIMEHPPEHLEGYNGPRPRRGFFF